MQKEQLSALMDGESLDNALLADLSQDATLQRSWESYHLIRDTLRGDLGPVIHVDIASRVAAAIEREPTPSVTPLMAESQPAPSRRQQMPFWQKVRPWAAQMTQVGVAACVSLAVIVGVQQYNASGAEAGTQQSEMPVLNTLPINGKASPVSLGVPAESWNNAPQQVQEQRRRVNAMLQDYELQRRLHADQLQLNNAPAQQAAVQVPGTQSLGAQQP
ncbi:anti-sigma-E factor RseA [Pantoea sp. 1.19]|uniref:anti-sigma-E factor RseA n=1 Tax=Pantoea sp. 1.19 TaxID=1925589 RepID=UPI0009490D0B|nr:anti-sigma-E factor RseA [Pantoea sp. 1.19]